MLSRELARFLQGRRDAGAIGAIGARVRLHIVDTAGVALAARRTRLADQLIGAAAFGGSDGLCVVIGRPERLSAPCAAYVNSSLAHMLDFDDVHDRARLHPTAVTFPAALAAAELAGADGPAIVAGVAMGNELMCRLGTVIGPMGTGPGAGWFLTQLFGYLGAAVAAGSIFGLSEDAMVSAIGLAYMQMAGGKEAAFGTGGNARAIYPAFASMGGLQAALLARAGIVGPESALDGAAGMFPLYLQIAPDSAMVAELLQPEGWLFEETAIKPWPSCRLSHPYVAGALALRANLDGRKIDRVVVEVNASAAKLCHPADERRRPRTLQDAKYSVPFMTAFALAKGKVDLSTLDDDSLEDSDVLSIASRVEVLESLPDSIGLSNGTVRVEQCGGAMRSPTDLPNGLDSGGVTEKFLSCADYGGLKETAAEKILSGLQALAQTGAHIHLGEG